MTWCVFPLDGNNLRNEKLGATEAIIQLKTADGMSLRLQPLAYQGRRYDFFSGNGHITNIGSSIPLIAKVNVHRFQSFVHSNQWNGYGILQKGTHTL